MQAKCGLCVINVTLHVSVLTTTERRGGENYGGVCRQAGFGKDSVDAGVFYSRLSSWRSTALVLQGLTVSAHTTTGHRFQTRRFS